MAEMQIAAILAGVNFATASNNVILEALFFL